MTGSTHGLIVRAATVLLTLTVGGLAGPGCKEPCGGPLAPGDHECTLTWNGKKRDYDIHVPPGYDGSPTPLVFDLHALATTKDLQRAWSKLDEISDAEGFLVARPNGQGITKSWNAGNCCPPATANDVDDVGFLKAVAAEIGAMGNVDTSRIYMSGVSNGGAMAHWFACHEADWVAAVAPVSFPISTVPWTDCIPGRPVPVAHFHGYDDVITSYDGVGEDPWDGLLDRYPSPLSFTYWAAINGCVDPQPAITFSQGSNVCETYRDCADGVEVTLCSIQGGHILYNNDDDVPVNQMIWDFLERWSLP